MSEENNMQSEQQEKMCKSKLALIISILALILSIASLATSVYNMQPKDTQQKQVVISKQYEKGRTLEKAKDVKKPMIVFFYTDWCGFCQRFAPVFDKVTKQSKIKKNFVIAFVNCEKQENNAAMQEYGVDGFPTVFVVDEEGNKTKLDNNIFFIEDAKKVLVKKILEVSGIETEQEKN